MKDQRLPNYFVHGNNILTKLKTSKKKVLKEVLSQYLRWKEENENITGMDFKSIKKKVKMLNEYKSFVDKIRIFSAQSQFHSTVIEEFLYYLFKDLIRSFDLSKSYLGGITAYSNLYFSPPNLREFQVKPFIRINEKDQDFAIYRPVEIKADDESKKINVPMVSIECKTYLDKTMLEGSIATAEKIKMGNPYCLFIVVTERYSVSLEVDPKYSRIDQIYVLRKMDKVSIDDKVVWDLFQSVKTHLERDWSRIEEKIRKTGKVL